MSDIKKFFELVGKDESVKAELEHEVHEAIARVAKAHGFNFKMEEVSSEELRAVAGGNFAGGKGKDICKEITLWDFEN